MKLLCVSVCLVRLVCVVYVSVCLAVFSARPQANAELPGIGRLNSRNIVSANPLLADTEAYSTGPLPPNISGLDRRHSGLPQHLIFHV